MADISQITLPSGSTYNLKDAWARTQIQAITGGSAIVFKGVSSTELTDEGNENPTVNGSVVSTKSTGDLYFYQSEEFIYGDDGEWHALGTPLQTLGALAYKNSVKYEKTTSVSTSITTSDVATGGNYTPAGTVTGGSLSFSSLTSTGSFTPTGTVSQPTFSGATLNSTVSYTPDGTIAVDSAGTTTIIKNPTAKTVTTSINATTPSNTVANEVTYYSVANENLTLYKIGYATDDSITTTNTTVKTGDASYTFNGSASTLTSKGTPAGTVSQPTFSGGVGSVSVSGTPSGTVSALGFSGQSVNITASNTVNNTSTTATLED